MSQAVLSALDYAIQLAEQGDVALHAGLAKLKALRAKVASALGLFSSSSEDCYGSLSDADKAEVDEQFASLQAAE